MLPYLIGACALVVTAGAIVVLQVGSRGQGRNARPLRTALTRAEGSDSAGTRGDGSEGEDASPLLTRILAALGLGDRLQSLLLQAAVMLRPSEALAVVLGLSAAGGVIGLGLLHSLPVAALGAAAGVGGPWLYLRHRCKRRVDRLNDQLAEALDLLATGLRTGYSFAKACQVVVTEMPPPISQELQWMLDEINVGLSQNVALERLAGRARSKDVRLVVTAVQIQTEIGGNLAEILENTGEMVRERIRLKQELKAVTAEGRLSAGVLVCLPFGTGLLVHLVSPGYMAPLFSNPLGHTMMLGGAVMMTLGVLVIRQLLQIEY
jgi:tight adherence protein B